MASTLDQTQPQTGSRKYVDFDEFIEYQVNRTRSGIKHTDLLTAGVTVALAVLAYLLAFVVLDHWVIPGGFSYLPRALMLGALLAFVIGWTGWKIVYPYLRRITALYAAREIEGTAPGLKSSLLTLVDLKRARRPVPAHIVAALEKRAAVNLSQMDVEQAVDRRPLMRLTYALFAVVAAMCLYTVLSPKSIASSIWRALAPTAQTAVATRTRIEKVDPGDATVLARSQLEVTVDVSGEVPQEATLRFTTADRSFVDEPVAMRETGEGLKRFRGMLTGPNGRGLLQDFTYFIDAGDARSSEYHVTVEQAPYATVEEVVYDYPDYMGLDARTQPGGEIDTWEGTTVTIRAVTNMPVVSATILYSDTEDTSVRGREGRFELKDTTHLEYTEKLQFLPDGTYEHFYRIQLRTAEGQVDPVPRLYTLKLRRDLPPELKLLHPSGDIEMPANGVLPIAYQASDPDFMLNSVRTYFEKDNLKLDAHTRRLYEAPPWQSQIVGTDQIDLAPFGLQPGDVLTFWLEAVDNMEPLGNRLGNRTVTPKLNITITEPVAQEQVEQQRDQQQQQAAQRLDEAQQQPQQQPGDETSAEPVGSEDRPPAGDPAETDPAEAQPPQQGERPQPDDAQRNQQPGEQADSGEQGTKGEQGAEQEPSAQPTQGESGGEQQQPDAEGQPQGTSEQGAEGGTQSQPQPRGNQQRPGNQPGQPGDRGQPQQRPSDDGGRASDDQALRELFDKYKDEIEQQRREGPPPDQQQPGDSDAQQSPSSDPNSQPQRSPGSESQGDQRSPADAQRSPGDASSPGREPRPGDRSPSPSTPREPRESTSGDQSGDSPGQTSPDNRPPPGEQPKPGEGTGTTQPQETPAGTEPMPGEGDPNAEGQRRPATDDAKPNGARQSADPNGERRPGAEPNANPSQTGEQPQGEPNGDRATSPGEKPADTNAERKPGQPGGARNPREAEPAPERQPGEEPMPGDRGDSGADPMPTDRPPSKTGGQPSGADMSDPGEGRPEGQRSEQPSGGEQGSSQQASEGTQGGNQEGPGDATSKPGSQSKAQGESGGKPGDQPGQGSTTQPGGQKPGGEEGMPADSEGTAGGEQPMADDAAGGKEGGGKEGGGKEGGGKDGGGNEGGGKEGGGKEGGGKEGGGKEGGGKEGGGKEGGGEQGGGESGGEGSSSAGGDQSSQGTSRDGSQSASSAARSGTGGGRDGQAPPEGAGGGGAGGDLTPEAAELADKRRASELILKRLEDELERGEVSEDLLKELGWSEDNLRDFMQRLQQRLSDTGDDQSPEAQARRNQFQEILRGIDYSSEGGARAAGEGARGTSQGFGGARRPAPAEFRRDQEAFKSRLSRESKK